MASLSNINGKFVVEQTTGNVGIGTTDPDYLLHVNSSDVTNGTRLIIENTNGSGKKYGLIADNTGVFAVRDVTAGADRFSISNLGNATFTGNVTLTTANADTVLTIGNSASGGIDWDIQSASSSSPYAQSSGDLLFRNASSNVLRLGNNGNATFAGNVQAPSVLANGFMEIRSDTAALYFENAANNNYYRFSRTSNDLYLDYYNGSSTTTYTIVSAAGEFWSKALFAGSGTGYRRTYLQEGGFRCTSSADEASTLDIAVDNTKTQIYSNYYSGGSNNDICISTYPPSQNQLYLKNTGNIGIGTDSPSSFSGYTNLSLKAGSTGNNLDFFNSSGTRIGAIVTDGSDDVILEASGLSRNLIFKTDNAGTFSEKMRITSGGYIKSPPTYSLTTSTAANMHVDSNGFFYRSTSSLKYKADVRDYDKGLNEVMQLQPKYYKGKTDGDKQFAGLIAEDVHDLGLTEFVQYADDGSPDALSYSHMVALLVKSIQELKADNDILKARIKILENK